MTDEMGKPVALVAGGGSGIGRGCALTLAEQGFHVIALGRTEAKIAETAELITAAGGTCDTFAADVRDWDRIAELGARLSADGIDLLVNSAGGQNAAPTAEMSREDWQTVIDINLTGAFTLCRLMYEPLKQRQGSVVTIVANMWQLPSPGVAHSAASRAGIVNLTRTLAKEWAPDGIRLNAVAPGLTDSGALPPQFAALADRVPLGRMGEVSDVVDAVLFFARASYVTGEVLSVDGGFRFVT